MTLRVVADNTKKPGRGFFKIDLSAFRRAAECGFNASLAYLVCARGSNAENTRSQWSAEALWNTVSISRLRSRAAFQSLIDAGVLEVERAGRHPIYKLPSGTDNVWLPNSLIDGAAQEAPPLELLNQTQNPHALHLLVMVYAEHLPLHHDGGIPRRLLKIEHTRTKIGEHAQFQVWGFESSHIMAHPELAGPFLTGKRKGDGRDPGWEIFFAAVEALTSIGLLEKVGALFMASSDDSPMIHPYGKRGGEPMERELATLAQRAAETMLTPGQREWAADQWLVPMPSHVGEAALIEVFRPGYRPHTKPFGVWHEELRTMCELWRAYYTALLAGEARAHPLSAPSRRQAGPS